MYVPGTPWWVYTSLYMPGIHTLGTPTMLHCPSVCLHVTDLLVHGVEEITWAQDGNNPWVGGEREVKVVNPVRVSREFCAELLLFSRT